jgi:predicted deacylase
MQDQRLDLDYTPAGTRRQLRVLRFGQTGARPKVYVQAALHADELPGVLVAHRLAALLAEAEAAGRLRGEVVLVPSANPLGLAQDLLGTQLGRFALADGLNFNRGFVDLAAAVLDARGASALAAALGDDRRANRELLRAALLEAAAGLRPSNERESLKATLLQLAVDADLVLDLHCDAEAVMHLYTLTQHAEQVMPLAALLGAEAMLTAEDSGDSPFDEACSRPWLQLQRRFAGRPIELACVAVTVELRGERDLDFALAERDARALFAYLGCIGCIDGPAVALPPPRCEPTPLAASEPLHAARAGVLVYHREVGERIDAGALVASVVDPQSGHAEPVHARSAGVFYARSSARWAAAGQRIGKIAGRELMRSGKLLSP